MPATDRMPVWRFEVRNSDGNYIKGASVQILSSSGKVLWTTTTDAGGNVAIDVEAYNAIKSKISAPESVASYLVSSPIGSAAGSLPAPGNFVQATLTPPGRAPASGQVSDDDSNLLLIGAVIVVGGLIAWGLYSHFSD